MDDNELFLYHPHLTSTTQQLKALHKIPTIITVSDRAFTVDSLPRHLLLSFPHISVVKFYSILSLSSSNYHNNPLLHFSASTVQSNVTLVVPILML